MQQITTKPAFIPLTNSKTSFWAKLGSHISRSGRQYQVNFKLLPRPTESSSTAIFATLKSTYALLHSIVCVWFSFSLFPMRHLHGSCCFWGAESLHVAFRARMRLACTVVMKHNDCVLASPIFECVLSGFSSLLLLVAIYLLVW